MSLINHLPDGWELTNLADIASQGNYGLVDGPFGSNLPASDYTLSGIPVIRGSNLSQGTIRFKDDNFVFVSDQTAQRLARSLCKHNDIIFTKKGTLGQVGIIPETARFPEYLLSSNQMKLSVNPKKANPLFIYYFVSSLSSREKILRDSEATGVPKINLAYLKTFPIILPSISEQQTIAEILSSLDEKIELNRQMNKTLEAIVQTIFKSWFINFDPVHAKMEGRELYEIDAETAALFPDGFRDSTLGKIPREWKVGVLDDVIESSLGGDWGGSNLTSEISDMAFCIRGADIPNLQLADTAKMPIRYLKTSSISKRKLKPGNIVIEISGGSPTQSTGRSVLITSEVLDRYPYSVVCSNFCRKLSLQDLTYSKYTYYWLRWLYDSGTLLQYENGTTGIKNFAYNIFSQTYNFVIPPSNLLERFEQVTCAISKKRENNGDEDNTLATLRDTLLPKLLSGQIRIKDAEKIAEAYI